MLFLRNSQCLLLLFVMTFLIPIDLKASDKQIPDSVLEKIMQNPESIVSYSTNELIENAEGERIGQICKIICSLNTNGIRRSVIKNHYYPLCRKIIKVSLCQSGILREMIKRRGLTLYQMKETDSISIGRDIITRFIEYQKACMAIDYLNSQDFMTPFAYGDMRFVENFVWGSSKYMDEIDPIPAGLMANVTNLLNGKVNSLEKDLYKLILSRGQEQNFILENGKILLEASTYLSQFQMGMNIGQVSSMFIGVGKKQELFDLFDSIFLKRWGDIWKRLKPIIIYRMTGGMEIKKLKRFHNYRDSLLSCHIEFAKYYPQNCPDDLKHNVEYEKYNDRFYDTIHYIFDSFIRERSINRFSSNVDILNAVGCNNQADFLKLYTEETLRRYYNKDDFKMWGNIEKIREYIENVSEYPIDIALHIAECYASINATTALNFIKHSSLENWINKQIEKKQQNEALLDAVSVMVYVYASLYNELRYPEILKYIKWTEENIELGKKSKDRIIYNIASALSLMEKNKESNNWISKIQVDNSDYNQEFFRLLLKNYNELGETKNAINVASKMKSFSCEDILCYFIARLKEGKNSDWDMLLSTFTASLSNDFNQIQFMNTDDQEWSLLVAKHRLNDLLFDMDMSIWIKDELHEGYDSLFKQSLAAMYYNYALASKGAVLRSNKNMREKVLNKMPTEQYQYFQQALDLEDDDSAEKKLERRIDKFTSNQSKAILLDYIRKDTTNLLPQFDYNIVRNQLQPEDIAIEVIQDNNIDSYNVAMIRKSWNFPKLIGFLRNKNKDNRQLLWAEIAPFLDGVKNIYISLDGEYNLENIELMEDSTGLCIADKYKIYRVSTTLNIPRDVCMSDIKHSVLYGNLKYADWENLVDEDIVIDNREGAICDYWMPLEETKEELDNIAGILSNENVQYKLYEEENGDKSSFKALNRQNVELLHLATHGFFNSVKDLNKTVSAMKRSGIVLANSAYDLWYKKQSGTLFANEISNMDLNSVKLLVLSACETANGELGDDGVFGLQRGFKQAGVGCIIMSLKKVNSKMTTELMTEFYSSFAKGKSVRDAFRNAQKQIATKYKIEDWKYFVVLD